MSSAPEPVLRLDTNSALDTLGRRLNVLSKVAMGFSILGTVLLIILIARALFVAATTVTEDHTGVAAGAFLMIASFGCAVVGVGLGAGVVEDT